MEKVSEPMEMARGKAQSKPLLEMVGEVVQRFLDAKLARTDISTALYRISAEIDGPTIVERNTKRCRKALQALVQTAPDIVVPLTSLPPR